jgi:hypothetical protein
MFQSVTFRQLGRRGAGKPNFVKVTPLQGETSCECPEMERPSPPAPRAYPINSYVGTATLVHTFNWEWEGWAPSKVSIYYDSGHMARGFGFEFLPFCAATGPRRVRSRVAAPAATARTKRGRSNGSRASSNLSPYPAIAANGPKFLSGSRTRPHREAPADDSVSNAPVAAQQRSPPDGDTPDAARFLAGLS